MAETAWGSFFAATAGLWWDQGSQKVGCDEKILVSGHSYINILSWNAMYTFDKLSNCRWCPAVLGQLVNSPSLHCTDKSSPAFHFMSWFSQQWSSPAKYLDLLAPALNQVFLSEGSAHNAIRDGDSTVQSYMCLGWIELLSKQCKYLDLRKWKIVMGLRLYLQLLQDKNPRSWRTLPIGR